MKLQLTNEKFEKVPNPWTGGLKMTRTLWNTNLLPRGCNVIGVDPGVNFGMTILTCEDVRVFYGRLLKQKYSMEYGWMAFNFIKEIVGGLEENTIFVLEGAAYNKTFGQVGLADVRTGFYLGARTILSTQSIYVVAPARVRKEVFGDGKYQAGLDYPTINHNAADSIGIALYGLHPPMRTDVEIGEGN